MRKSECVALWDKISRKRLWLLMERNLPYLDPDWADESGLPEALIRVFFSKDEALEYEGQMYEIGSVNWEETDVSEVDLDTLWGYIEESIKKSRRDFESEIRIDICKLVDEEHPIQLDTLYRSSEISH